jgi:hypothetical protein
MLNNGIYNDGEKDRWPTCTTGRPYCNIVPAPARIEIHTRKVRLWIKEKSVKNLFFEKTGLVATT